MASSLPDSPSLERLKADARHLQREVRTGDAQAIALVRSLHPTADTVLRQRGTFPLHAAQLSVARKFGFDGWPALVHYLAVAAQLSRDPGGVAENSLDPADRFCALACLRYADTDGPQRWQAAAEVLAQEQGVVASSVWAASAACDPEAIRSHLDRDWGLARRPGGPFDWPPLLYLSYSRVPVPRTEEELVAAATALLEAGADPDSGYLWRGLSSPFTALTGAFGHGEQGPRRLPAHQHAHALARLLLDAGADPNDSQTLYNRMFTPADDHLELLLGYGLGGPATGPWARRLGQAMETPEQMLRRQVQWAADHGFTERLGLLSRYGVDVAGVPVVTWRVPDDPDIKVGGRTALHEAAWDGDLDRIRALLAAGAEPTVRDDEHAGTPLDWAEYAFQEDAARLLRQVAPRTDDGVG